MLDLLDISSHKDEIEEIVHYRLIIDDKIFRIVVILPKVDNLNDLEASARVCRL